MNNIFIYLEIIICVLIGITMRFEKKRPGNIWRLIYSLPLFIGICMFAFIQFDFKIAGVLLGTCIMCGCLFTSAYKKKQIIAVSSLSVMVLFTVLGFMIKGINNPGFVSDFDYLFNVMREHYVLTDEKSIDWDELYDTYRPLVLNAEIDNDKTEYFKVMTLFTQEFYDGHVSFALNNESDNHTAMLEAYGNDYGLSLMRLSDGRFVAVNVEGCGVSYSINDKDQKFEKADEYLTKDVDVNRLTILNAGIKNGTVITSWDGKSMEELMDEQELYLFPSPDKVNEEFYLPICAAGNGGDTVEITFIDDDGLEKKVTAPKLGAYAPRLLDTINKIDAGENISNLDTIAIDDNTVLLRIYVMAYDGNSYEGAEYDEMTDKLRDTLLAYKNLGYTRLIIDLRQNNGGSPFMVTGVVKLFAPGGEHFSQYTGVIDTASATYYRGDDGKYIKNEKITYMGEDIWADGEIILLVNGETVSAGDYMTYVMAEYPNVTITGFTGSNSSCQAVTVVEGKMSNISFSAVPNLDENGVVMIDTFTDHVRRVPIDTIIPINQDVIDAVFNNGEDYILDYVLNNQ